MARFLGRIGVSVALPTGLMLAAGSNLARAEELGPIGAFPAVMDYSAIQGPSGITVRGAAAYEFLGGSVAGIGDINGDGVDDIAIRDSPTSTNAIGRVMVVFGGTGLASGPLAPSLLDGTNGFVIEGEAGDSLGISMDGIGDVNGDGWDDLVVGAYWSNPGGRTRAGSTYIVFGGPGVGSTGMLLLGTLDGTNGFVIHGIDADDGSGWSVSGAGDVNGDGVHDVLIGAPDARPAGARSGEVYIVFGRNTAVDGAFSPTLELSSLDGENGVVLTGPRSDAWVGGALAALGDVNSDGVDDIGIGKRLNLPRPGANEAYVVYGRDAGADGPFPAVIALGSLDGVAGFKITCAARAGEIGGGFASAGDINHDGAPDFLVGAHLVDVGGLVDAGAVYIIYGRTGADAPFPASLHAPSLDGTDGFILPGYEASMAVGRAPTGGSDLNGDGVDDIALHIAPSAVVVYGRDAAADGAFPAVLDISTPDASRGVRITGVVPNDYAGLPEFAGDLNDDGFEDLVVRSPFQTSNGLAYAGEVYVLFGRERRLQMLCPADVDGDAVVDASDFVVVASHYGQHVTPGTDGDLNGDGVVDASDFVILAANFGCSE